MTQAAPAVVKIPTKSPQRPAASPRATGRAWPGAGTRPGSRERDRARAATRGGGEVIELEYGITVYPARDEHGRWRAVWHEDGQRRQCESVTEEKLAARLEKVRERLQAGAPDMKRPGADLIAHYLDPDRLPRRRAVVPQARAHPAAAVRAVRRPGHRHGHLPGHQGRAHAEDRQRRAHAGGGHRVRG